MVRLSSLVQLLVTAVVTWGWQPASADEVSMDIRKYNLGGFGALPRNKYRSNKLTTPMLGVNTWNQPAISDSGSHIFLRHDGHLGRRYDAAALILDANDLSAVYVNRSFEACFDVRVQKNFNESYLTFYGGPRTLAGHGDGYSHVLDSSYREVYSIAPTGLSVKSDIHEFQFTGHGTAIVTAYEAVDFDTHPWGGPEEGGALWDSVFQEIELETGEALFTWRASEHINPTACGLSVDTPWDFFHLNSVQKSAEGNYLISARHVSSVYMINGTDGSIMWTLGGLYNQFVELPAEGEFSNSALSMSWQHHARFFPGNESEITIFDNHVISDAGHECRENCSRGIHLALDTQSDPPTVQLLHEYLHPKGLLSPSQGSVEILENGNVFMGWGWNPAFSEHTIDGEVVMDVQFSPWKSRYVHDQQLDNYRAYKLDWKGTPFWDPEMYVEQITGSTVAYLSWNGATELKSWVVLASDVEDEIDSAQQVVAWVPRGGFETTVELGSLNSGFFRAVALDAEKKIIGASGIFNMTDRKVYNASSNVTDIGELTALQMDEDEDSSSSMSNMTTMLSDMPWGWRVILGLVMVVGLVWALIAAWRM